MSIKVLVVDDSAVFRELVQAMLKPCADIEVIGAAIDPIVAMSKMKRTWPDVVVLDVVMPRMDGITFLKRIAEHRPTPVVICSSTTPQGSRTALDALAAGATSIVSKPEAMTPESSDELAANLAAAIREAAAAPRRAAKGAGKVATASTGPVRVQAGSGATASVEQKLSPDVVLTAAPLSERTHLETDRFIAIGASTGGTEAIEEILVDLPADAPGIVIVQHMPQAFTGAYAQRLNEVCAIEVREARNHDPIEPGVALIAPGGVHLLVRRNSSHYYVELKHGPRVSRHCPSVDVLFRSVALSAGPNAVGIILTGMGDDGAIGLRELRETGAWTYAQDEESCVVFGMPKEAIKAGGVRKVLPLGMFADLIVAVGVAAGRGAQPT